MLRLVPLLFVLLVFSLFTGCAPKNQEPSQEAIAAESAQITDEQVQTMGKSFEEKFKSNPIDTFSEFIKIPKILDGLKKHPLTRNLSFKDMKDIEATLKNPEFMKGIQAPLTQQISGAIFAFSSVKRDDNGVYAVMRLELPDDRVNYWFLRCRLGTGNTLEADDIFIPNFGDTINGVVVFGILVALQQLPDFMSRWLKTLDDNGKKRIEVMGKMCQALTIGNKQNCIKVYETDSGAELNASELDLLYVINIIQLLQTTKNKSKVEELEAKLARVSTKINSYNSNCICCDMPLIDVYNQLGKYDEARKSIQNVRNVVGADPYLDLCEGISWYKTDQQKAISAMKEAGKKGLRSKLYLAVYYVFMKNTPGSSTKATQKIYDTGIELYGDDFKQTVSQIIY